MSNNKNVDYLSRLPPELLDYVFELVHVPISSWFASRHPISSPSRYLQPFFDRALYNRVSVKSFHGLDRFCCRVGDDAIRLVRSLIIKFPWKATSNLDPENWEQDSEEEQEDYDYPSSQEFVTMLKRATEVEELLIQGSTRLALLVLSSSVAVSSLPILRSLTLVSTFAHLDDPYHPIHYNVLPYYSTLHQLSITIIRKPDSIFSLPSNPIPPCHLPLCSLRQLSLKGPILSSSHVPIVMASLFNLAELSLEEVCGDVRLLRLVELIPSPERLQRLQVNFTNFSSTGRSVPSPLPNVSFDRFSCLRSLSIIGRVNLCSPPFYRAIEALTCLKELTFGYDTLLSVSMLSRSIDSLKLKSLVLDQLSCTTSETDPNFWLWLPDVINEEELDRSPIEITRPGWTDDFSKEGFTNLGRKCLVKGVSLKGSTVKAFVLECRFDSGELERDRAIRLELKKKHEEQQAQGDTETGNNELETI
ncbi:hypothetical protein JCM3765_005759 [Sporobolomyces pararoseus]